MTWDDIRRQHPHSWVLVEAIEAYTDGAQRVIGEMRLIKAFGADWERAWESYKDTHHADRSREYYILHTDRQALDIGVIDAFGRVLQ